VRIREAARAIVLDPTDRVLLVRFEFPAGTRWACPGGGIDADETAVDALRRELAEETGLVDAHIGPAVWTRLHVIPFLDGKWDGQREVFHVVRAPAFEPRPQFSAAQLSAEYLHEVRWWTVEELGESDATFAPRRFVQHCCSTGRRMHPSMSVCDRLASPPVPSTSTIAAFAAATIALLLIPGPAVIYILNRSISDGREVGLASVAGLEVGDAIQVLFAAFGLSAVLATSATAFNVVKWAGVAYLLYIGITTLARPADDLDPAQPGVAPRQAFRQGIVVNALNPKTALFFLSIFPQFIRPEAGRAITQSLVLGVVFLVLATLFNGTYALLASTFRGVLLRNRAVPFVRRWVAGGVFVGLGLLAATASAGGHRTTAAR
jgi:threonine/homoserine/homoserine lactone efflux protein/ADP-ribose pyrophosphatase YjhB (NUDIX family)